MHSKDSQSDANVNLFLFFFAAKLSVTFATNIYDYATDSRNASTSQLDKGCSIQFKGL